MAEDMADYNDKFGSRTQSFGQGAVGGDDVASSLEHRSAAWTAAASHSFRPESVLNQFQRSPNGLSPETAQRRLPDGRMLPSQDSSDETNKLAELGRVMGNLK